MPLEANWDRGRKKMQRKLDKKLSREMMDTQRFQFASKMSHKLDLEIMFGFSDLLYGLREKNVYDFRIKLPFFIERNDPRIKLLKEEWNRVFQIIFNIQEKKEGN